MKKKIGTRPPSPKLRQVRTISSSAVALAKAESRGDAVERKKKIHHGGTEKKEVTE
jgi:hypothetical protein